MNRSKEINAAQVLIIGAGISGLEAARLLQENGIKTLILEARNRTGGRIWSMRSKNSHILDMGANYIHGIRGSIPSGLRTNPIWDLTQEAKIRTRSTEKKDFLGSYSVDDSISVIRSWGNEYKAFVRDETRISSTNVSFEYYANLFAKQKNLNGKQHDAFFNYLFFTIGNVEGAELDILSAKGLLDIGSAHYGDEHIFSETGYMALTDYLAKDVTGIRLEQVVTKINYNEKLVEVSTNDGQIYRAEFVLVTVPLGVLKSKQIEFTPELPRWKLDAIDRIGFGNYEKVFLLWDRVWWNSSDFTFVRTSSESIGFRYWGSSDKLNNKATITCIFAGKSASQLKSTKNQNEIVKEIRNTLQTMFPNITVPPPIESYMTHWNQDSFSFGSYSHFALNQKYEDSFYLSEPINNRLLFAGEATSIDTYGYTHGALLTARREVTRLLFVYDLLPEQNTTTSQSTLVTPLAVFIMINIIWLQLCLY
jgi:monoamine oxidase